jgi:hypothetical protein
LHKSNQKEGDTAKPFLIRKDKHIKKPYINYSNERKSYQQFLKHKDEPELNDLNYSLAKFETNTLRLWESRFILKRRILRKARRIHQETL